MINLTSELMTKLKISTCNYQLINISGNAIYVYNHKGIVVFSPSQMVFKLKGKKTLIVEGENLSLVEMDSVSVIISGTIFKTEVV